MKQVVASNRAIPPPGDQFKSTTVVYDVSLFLYVDHKVKRRIISDSMIFNHDHRPVVDGSSVSTFSADEDPAEKIG